MLRKLLRLHPILQMHLPVHERCRAWSGPEWQELLAPTMVDERTQLAYD